MNNWRIYIPAKAEEESIRKRPLDENLLRFKGERKVLIISGDPSTIRIFKNQYTNLGSGEIESIAIAHNCLVKKSDSYLLLTDDNVARKKAQSLGIESLGIVSFFILANKLGVLSRKKVIQYLDTLSKNDFVLKSKEYNDSIRLLS